MKKIWILVFVAIATATINPVYSKHQFKESAYQEAYCSLYNGQLEFVNEDMTRVDCLTSENAIEFDFAEKWAESIGQALHYQYLTHKRAKVVLILENPERDIRYYKRVKDIAEIYDFDVEYITNEILIKKDQ